MLGCVNPCRLQCQAQCMSLRCFVCGAEVFICGNRGRALGNLAVRCTAYASLLCLAHCRLVLFYLRFCQTNQESALRMADTDILPKSVDSEKHAQIGERTLESNGYDGSFGDLQVLSTSDSSLMKTAADGKTVLIPQPSDSPDDPLNWSFVRSPERSSGS